MLLDQWISYEKLVGINKKDDPIICIKWFTLFYRYALLYSNVARLAVTGFIPLFLLAYFNYRIFIVLKRRRRMNNRPHAANSSQVTQHNVNMQYSFYKNNLRICSQPNLYSFINLLFIVSLIFPILAPNKAAQQKQEETRQSIMLFAIVIIFVLCHALRIILNVNTLFR